MKQALLIRYSLIPFWYTLHHKAAMISRTVVQPLFFEYITYLFHYKTSISIFFFRYPNDNNTLNIDQQFLIGRALLVSPNLKAVNKLFRK